MLSYSSSPPDTVPKGGTVPTTSALLGTCYRQVEYAGVLAGSQQPAGMRTFIAFMRGRDSRPRMPDQMYVYPVTGRPPAGRLEEVRAGLPKPYVISPPDHRAPEHLAAAVA